MKFLGIALIVAGVLMIFFAGPFQSSYQPISNADTLINNSGRRHTSTATTYAGGIAAICGLIVIMASRKKK